jgi:hypothetical protein
VLETETLEQLLSKFRTDPEPHHLFALLGAMIKKISDIEGEQKRKVEGGEVGNG